MTKANTISDGTIEARAIKFDITAKTTVADRVSVIGRRRLHHVTGISIVTTMATVTPRARVGLTGFRVRS